MSDAARDIVNDLFARRRRICTYYDPPPIPDRRWDWTARLDDYEPHGPVGHGATEREALIDLAYQMEE